MKIAVVATDKPGISTTLVGEQVMDALKRAGHEVVPVYVDGRADKPMSQKSEIARTPTICLVEHKTRDILRHARFARPTALVSVFTGNWEGYETPERLAYMALFLDRKFEGVPIAHVSHSDHTDQMMRATARHLLSPATARRIAEQSNTFPYGVDKAFQPGDNDPDLLIAPMNRVVSGAKNVGLHAELTQQYQRLAAKRGLYPKTLFYYAPGFGPEESGAKFEKGVYAFEEQPAERAAYVANARRTGLFFSVSAFESFGIYYLELLFSGAIGVFADRPWVRQLLGDYPFIVRSDEIAACLLHLRENYAAERQRLIDKVLPRLRAKFDLDNFAGCLVSQLTHLQS